MGSVRNLYNTLKKLRESSIGGDIQKTREINVLYEKYFRSTVLPQGLKSEYDNCRQSYFFAATNSAEQRVIFLADGEKRFSSLPRPYVKKD
jgi:hypothetical protein